MSSWGDVHAVNAAMQVGWSLDLTLASCGADTTLTANRIGRDQVLRFRIDDWVTITDDHRELMGTAPEPARIASPIRRTASILP